MFRAKTTVRSISFQLAQLFRLGASPCTLLVVAEETWSLLAQLQQGDTLPTRLLTVHGKEEKTHLKPANSGTRIKAGEESYFATAVLVISPIQTKL